MNLRRLTIAIAATSLEALEYLAAAARQRIEQSAARDVYGGGPDPGFGVDPGDSAALLRLRQCIDEHLISPEPKPDEDGDYEAAVVAASVELAGLREATTRLRSELAQLRRPPELGALTGANLIEELLNVAEQRLLAPGDTVSHAGAEALARLGLIQRHKVSHPTAPKRARDDWEVTDAGSRIAGAVAALKSELSQIQAERNAHRNAEREWERTLSEVTLGAYDQPAGLKAFYTLEELRAWLGAQA